MDHIYDNVGLDAQGAVKLVVPHSVNIGAFPSAATQKGGWRLDAFTGDMLWSDGMVWKAAASITPAGLTKFDDANMTLSLGGSPSNALLQGVSLTLAWAGMLPVGRGGSGAAIFTPGYLKANGTSAFTTVGTIPYSDISGTPTIPVALWADKRLAFGQTAAGGLTYDSYIKYDYSTYSFTIGSRDAGTEGLYSAVIGITNLNSDNYTFQIGNQLSNISGAGNLNIGNNNTGTTSFFSALIGKTLTYTGSYSIIGGLSQSVNGSNNGIFGGYNYIIGSFNLISGVNHDVTGDRNFVHGYLNTITHTGVTMLSDANYTGTTASTADNQFIGRFGNGYIFKLTASSTAVAINSSGQIVANFVPSSPSSTDIIVRGGGNILSYRTVASLPFTNNTGTVINFSAHDLTTFTDPLFTVNVTNPTTTPDLTFTLPTLTQKLVFAAPWGVSGQPFWRQLLPSDLSRDGASTGQVIAWNGTAWVPSAAVGGVTLVSPGVGMNFTAFSTTGTITMGTPSNITLASTNSATGTTHSHAFVPGGSASTQYITGSGALATNLWTAYGGYLMPTGGNAVRTNNTGGHGYILLEKGNASNSGNLQIYNTSARVGYIGNELSFMNYTAETGNHRFNGNNVYLDVIPSQPTGAYLLCTTTAGSGIISYRNVSTLTGIPSSLWFDQGTATPSTSPSTDIYRTGSIRIGASGSSPYKLSVVGTAYLTTGIDINNYASSSCAFRAFDFGGTLRNVAYIDSSNIYNFATTYMKINGVGVADPGALTMSAYPNTRNDVNTVWPLNVIYTNASGKYMSARGDLFQNDGGSVKITVDETNHIADSSPRRVTFNTIDTTNNTYISYDVSVGTDVKMRFGSSDMRYFVIAQIGYTMTGTSNVKMELRKTATAWETLEDTFTTKGSLTIHTIMSGGVTDYPSIYLTVSGAAINLYNARITMIPIGLTPP